MQRLKVIAGNRQEGKTTELMEFYFKSYALEVIKNNFNLVFISRLPVDMFEEYKRTMIPNTLNVQQVECINSGTHTTYFNVSSVENLKEIINNEISKKDSIFYIDDCGEFFNAQDAVNLMNEYPNLDYDYSFDIYMTMDVVKSKPISEFIKDNDWFNRLIAERNTLQMKIESLKEYIETEQCKKLSQHQRDLLDLQFNGMITYYGSLSMRVELICKENKLILGK
jgi:hypothetical protein